MTARLAIPVSIVVFGVTGLILAGNLDCSDHAPPATPPGPPAVVTPMTYRGMAIQIQTSYQAVQQFVPLLKEVADLGANTVLLITAGYMEHAESQMIYIEARKTPTPEDFKTIIREARKLDLQVIVMPIVLLSKPRGSEWRGVINPPDWDDWWRQYREFIAYFCEIARDGGANALMVGSELVSTEDKKYTPEWLKVIELARANFYGGQLGYSANWDHYRPVKFWDKLDFIGMTSYYTLADKKNPSVDEIVAKWMPIRDEITAWQREIGKPLLFTEVGWCSQEGAAMAPWNYYQFQKATPAGLEEQRRLYEAFLKVWDGTPGVAGIIWWDWSQANDAAGKLNDLPEADFGYSPRGKPAEQVLRRWFAKYRSTSPPSPTGPGASSTPASQPAGPAPASRVP